MSFETHSRRAWWHFDQAFAHFDRAFAGLPWRKFDDCEHRAERNQADPQGRIVHTITAKTRRSRWRFARLFLWLAIRIVLRGGSVKVRL